MTFVTDWSPFGKYFPPPVARNWQAFLEAITLGTGVGQFTGLTDTPSSYVGQSLLGVRVNQAETALEFGVGAGSVPRDEWLQNGFPDASEVDLDWDDSTRTLTITPSGASFRYYHDGVLYTESTGFNETISDTEGLWVFYIDGQGSFTSLHNPSHTQIDSVIENETIVAYVYWNAASNDGRLMYELHGSMMSPATHHYLHDTVGSVWKDGMSLANMVVDGNGSLDSHAQFSISLGSFYDEDIEESVIASAQTATKEIYYTNSLNQTRWLNAATNFPVYSVGGVIAYNNAGTLTAVANNRYVLYHVFATNIRQDDASNIACIMVPGEATYLSKSAAQSAAETEIGNITSGSWPIEETVPIATVIYYHLASMSNTVEAAVVSTSGGDDYIDHRGQTVKGSGSSTTDHGTLGGLADDDHLQYFPLTAGALRAITGELHFDIAGSPGIYIYTAPSTSDQIAVFTDVLIRNLVDTEIYADLTIGNGAASYSQFINKSAVGIGQIGFKVAGVLDWSIYHGTSEAFSIYDDANSLTRMQITHLADIDFYLAASAGEFQIRSSAGVSKHKFTEDSYLFDSTGNATFAIDKGAANYALIKFLSAGTGQWWIEHTTGESFRIYDDLNNKTRFNIDQLGDIEIFLPASGNFVINNEWGTNVCKFMLADVILRCDTNAPADADMMNKTYCIYASGTTVSIKFKDYLGTTRTGTVATVA
jgi:hypothetical protein